MSEARALVHRSANHGMANPYVTVRLVPGSCNHQPESPKFRTATQSRTLFPLYDETFDLSLPPAFSPSSAYILLTVKDRGPLSDKMFLGEAVLPVADISQCDPDCRMEDLQQLQLALTRPGTSVLDIVTALETRRWDTDILTRWQDLRLN